MPRNGPVGGDKSGDGRTAETDATEIDGEVIESVESDVKYNLKTQADDAVPDAE